MQINKISKGVTKLNQTLNICFNGINMENIFNTICKWTITIID